MFKRIDKARLDELIDEATIDCYGEEEKHVALLLIDETCRHLSQNEYLISYVVNPKDGMPS